MTDTLAALIQIFMSDSSISQATNNRIYDEDIPSNILDLMPIKTIFIQDAGGIQQTRLDPLINPRYDIFCYGETKTQARLLAGYVHDCLQNVNRRVIANCLIHSIGLSSGLLTDYEPDTHYPVSIKTITVLTDTREI